MTYQVKVFHNMLWRRHVDHLRLIAGSDPEGSTSTKPSDEFTMLSGTLVAEPVVVNTPTVSSEHSYCE